MKNIASAAFFTLGTLILLTPDLGRASSADPWIKPAGMGFFTPEAGPDARVISLSNGIVFDPRVGDPVLPRHFLADASDDVYLVHFSGPVRETWLAELTARGAVVYAYIPNYAFVVRMTDPVLAYAKTLPRIRWIGVFQPAYKVAEAWLFSAAGRAPVLIQYFPDADIEAAIGKITALGGTIREQNATGYSRAAIVDIDLERVADLAKLPEVLALGSGGGEAGFFNNHDQWVCQQGWLASAPPDTSLTRRPIWRRGLRGQGQIVGNSDSGINFNIGTAPNNGHQNFRDPSVPITASGDYAAHRKVVAYKIFGAAVFGDHSGVGSYHGTHVNGSISGNDTVTNGTGPDMRDGMAKDARINFTDIGTTSGISPTKTNLASVWDTVTRSNAAGPVMQHSSSWGWSDSLNRYLFTDAATDAWHWQNKMVVFLMAAGNSGTSGIVHPACAKNVITVGATQNGTASNTIASFSSRGPAQDGRVKPTICAPGNAIYSADGATTNAYKSMSGTSMATPSANGALVLIRQYFQNGWYPLGRPRAANSLDPSAALMRAMAVCSGDSGVSGYVPPESNAGFGRLDLDSVLYFDTLGTDSRKLGVVDDRNGYATGQYVEYAVNVLDSTLPLRCALAWVDTAAALQANPTLVNDLNLELENPSAVSYRGNQMSGWRSTPNPSSWDNRNVEEIARIVNPQRGEWRIRVRFNNTPQGSRVWFGLVVTGGIQAGGIGVEEGSIPVRPGAGRPVLVQAAPNPTAGEIRLDYVLPSQNRVLITVYNSSGRMVKELVRGNFSRGSRSVVWDGRDAAGRTVPAGIYFFRFIAGDLYQELKIAVIR